VPLDSASNPGTGLRLAVVTDRVGATQHISFIQPLSRLTALGHARLAVVRDREAGLTAKTSQKFLVQRQPTALVFSRYTEGRCQALFDQAREAGIPIIFHIDDDLLDPPLSLGKVKYEHYRKPERLAALRKVMMEADLVYASTPELAEALRRHGITTPMIAGDIYCSVDLERMPLALPATGPVIGYMGTEGHAHDLALVLPVIERMMTEIPELRFETFGTIVMPSQLSRFGSRVAHHPPVADYDQFLTQLGRLGWWVGLAPLEDTPFNRCKADTKWVEYTYSGIAVIASDGPVYRRACAEGAGLLATKEADWIAGLHRLINSRTQREVQLARARQRLINLYGHAALEAQLLDVLHQAALKCLPVPAIQD
jgi:hypothetical protein